MGAGVGIVRGVDSFVSGFFSAGLDSAGSVVVVVVGLVVVRGFDVEPLVPGFVSGFVSAFGSGFVVDVAVVVVVRGCGFVVEPDEPFVFLFPPLLLFIELLAPPRLFAV